MRLKRRATPLRNPARKEEKSKPLMLHSFLMSSEPLPGSSVAK
jgi:hypothetical protein